MDQSFSESGMSNEEFQGLKWELVGHVGIGSATIFISDPAATLANLDGRPTDLSFEEYFHRSFHTEEPLPSRDTRQWYGPDGSSIGVSVETGLDGNFPVYVGRDEEGHAAEIRISIKEVWKEVYQAFRDQGVFE